MIHMRKKCSVVTSVSVKVIPKESKLLNNFFETFPECSLPSAVLKKAIKRKGHRTR